MNCATFQALLDGYQKQMLSPEQRAEARRHLEVCAECRWLVQPPPALLPREAALELTSAILARTAGPACARLRDLACAYVDGDLDTPQASLVQGHLEHCPDCSALVLGLQELDAVLPGLALVEPGPRFTREVLRATSRDPIARKHPYSWSELREFWWRLFRRPRICFEAAYLGTVAGVLVFNLPHPTWHAGHAVLEVAQEAQPGSRVRPLLQSARRLAVAAVGCERRGEGALRVTVQRGLAVVEAGAGRQLRGMSALWQNFSGEMTERVRRLKQGQEDPSAEAPGPE